MLADTSILLQQASQYGYAVGAFNIYNLEGALAVVQAAEEMRSPVILQLLPKALEQGGRTLIAMCLALGQESTVEVAVHLDHCSSPEGIEFALAAGLTSIMADGSNLEYPENIRFTRDMVKKAGELGGTVEAELGRLSGEEDGLPVAQREAQMTNPDQAEDFVAKTGISALAVCIGNVHGRYLHPPQLDFNLLAAITNRVAIPLVLHGTSGLPDEMIQEAIRLGVCKFNVNTEIRSAYIRALTESFATSSSVELVPLMQAAIAAMKQPVQSKITLFCSADKTSTRKH
ncbi:MAG: class II fructose-bisphosphate aldolase family protein [Proteobacteria bacterium]|nr:class II fructose-bisphosphate aldolase family protein [Pseudomonadota bacterium]